SDVCSSDLHLCSETHSELTMGVAVKSRSGTAEGARKNSTHRVLRLRLDSGRRRGASACASAAATAVVVGSRIVISGAGLDPGVQARADELALVARGARGVEGRGEDEGRGAERPLRLVPGLDHEGQAAARGLQVAAEGRLEASLP